METHVKVLAVLHLVFSSLGLMCALLLMVIFGGAAGIVGMSGDADAATAVPIIGLAGSAIVTILLVLSLPGFVVGIGLWQRRSWARIGGIVLAFFNLPGVPFFTLLGIYGLWVLLSRDTERLFAPASSPTVSA